MQDISIKLLKHLRWRLSPAGKKFKPKREEVESWAPQRIPASVPLLLWLAFGLALLFGALSLPPQANELLEFFTVGAGGWVIAGLLLRWAGRSLNHSFIIAAYKRLLVANERFALVEYTRYLERQIKRARTDPALGGAAEVNRLLGVYGEMKRLLHEGAGRQGGVPVVSALAEDAELGEALVQTYGELQVDPLMELDSRLPAELRQRLEDLDHKETAGRRPQQQELN